MHLTQIAFLALLLVALSAALGRGGLPERVGAALFLGAALATPLVETAWFEQPEYKVATIDALLLLTLLALAFQFNRRWPIFAAAFQACGALVHVARLAVGTIHGDAYAHLAVFWSYPVLFALLWGSLIETRKPRATAAAWPGTRSPERFAAADSGRHGQLGREPLDDCELLKKLLELHGFAQHSEEMARTLIAHAGSFAAAITTPAITLRAWQMDERVINAFAFARSAVKSSLRRKLETRPRINSAEVALDYLHSEIAHLPYEQFRVLYLNSRFRLVYDEIHSDGSVCEASVYTREIIKRALETGAVNLIFAHNHPGGDPSPSHVDIALTREIRDAAKPLGIAIMDHFVISASGHFSLRAAALF